MPSIVRDVRYAIRRLMRQPVFALVAIASLAIGIGANSAIFSLVNAVLLRDQAIERPEELVDIYRSVAGFSHATFSYPDYEEVERATGAVFSDVAATRLSLIQTDIDGAIESVMGELVSGNYFPMLGVSARLGRTLLPEDDVSPGGHPVTVISHQFWQNRFGADPEIVGKSIRLNGRPYEIVGVAANKYNGYLRSLQSDLFAPIMMTSQLAPSDDDELVERSNQSTFVKARLVAGAELAEARLAMERLEQDFKKNHPRSWPESDAITVVPSEDVVMNPMVDGFLNAGAALMVSVVGLILLIACANLASFLLAQMTERRQEIALRLALGSNRWRLLRQFATESLLLAVLGGALGIVLGMVLLRMLLSADLPVPFPIEIDAGLDLPVLGFSVVVTLLAGLFLGLVPALRATRPELASTLRDESAGGGQRGRLGLRGALVVAQIAMSMLLLVGAGLFSRSLQERMAVDPGFGDRPAAVLTMQTPPDRYNEEESRTLWRQFLEEAAAVPGVTAVGVTGDLNLNTVSNWGTGITVDGMDPPPGEDAFRLDWTSCDAGFFSASGIQIVDGRGFDDRDVEGGQPVAIVSMAMAEKFWPGESAVGKTFREDDEVVTVVGVAENAKIRSLGEAPRPFLYEPFRQNHSSFMTAVASTEVDPESLVIELLALAKRIDPELLIYDATTMERHLAIGMLPYRLSAWLISGFGLLSLLLASIGLYGVVSYAVASRIREVGIRVSLGAEPSSVVRLLMGNGLLLAGLGGVIGLVLAFLASRLLGSLLYGVSAIDPVAFVAVPLVLGAVAALAAYLPARRASSIDPVRALQGD